VNTADEPTDAIRRGREVIEELTADAEAVRRRGGFERRMAQQQAQVAKGTGLVPVGGSAGLFRHAACQCLRLLGNFDGRKAVKAAGFDSASTALKFIAAERRRKRGLAAA